MSKNNGPRIALIHAVAVAIDPIAQAFDQHWPEARRLNLLEDTLSPDRALNVDLMPAIVSRIEALADYAILAGSDAILYTCSAFGPAIERVASRLPVPVLKPNEAMFADALGRGDRIGMLATFAPAVVTMEAEFRETAQRIRPAATLRTILVDHAMEALQAGNADLHNRLIADRASEFAECDAIMLAHFSTSRAKTTVESKLGREVLTSPAAAVRFLRHKLTGR